MSKRKWTNSSNISWRSCFSTVGTVFFIQTNPVDVPLKVGFKVVDIDVTTMIASDTPKEKAENLLRHNQKLATSEDFN